MHRFASANEMIQALLAGQIDVTGMSSLSVVAKTQSENPGVLKLLTLEEFSPGASPDAIVVRPDTGITSLEELEGRTLGTWKGSTIAAYTRVILEAADLPPGSVNIVPMGKEEMVSLFQLGEIDAAFTFEPFVSLLQKSGGAVLERAPLSRRLLETFPL